MSIVYPAIYPDQFPGPCIAQVVEIVRSGAVAERKAELGQSLWCAQGYLQRLSLGVPVGAASEDVCAAVTDDETERLDELALACQSAREQLQSSDQVFAADDKDAIDPATIIALVTMVMQLLKAWRNR